MHITIVAYDIAVHSNMTFALRYKIIENNFFNLPLTGRKKPMTSASFTLHL